MISDEKFFAWLDGELGLSEAATVAAAVAADPRLSARAGQHRALAASLRAAFDPLIDAPVPDRIAEPPVDLAAEREQRRARSIPLSAKWGAIAATLVVGIVTGTMLASDPAPSNAMSAELGKALDVQLASAPTAGAVRIGLTFRDRKGALCRSFETSGEAGLACREGRDWQLRGRFAQEKEASGDYRMAAGNDPRLIELIEQSIAGQPFDEAAERRARAGGWR